MLSTAPSGCSTDQNGVWRTSAWPPETQKAASAAPMPAIQKIGPPRDAGRPADASDLRSISMPSIDGVAMSRAGVGMASISGISCGSTS
ncbi:hypothetical protein NLY44_18840 [Mesorhizobium sp. C089B]|uniref:hypothetical protein n=1 Tax=Mesorhizobium sp. C089B TaxID=2956823 RepID=UPI002576E2EF|nr:hypothetical protein [Mesorhizobium sp. C089B]WJI48731.1 hypothetical protein NLY44_18840 [Mesorhizobium sp. C089B]